MVMVMVVMPMTIMMMVVGGQLLAPRPPQHPTRDGNDQRTRGELEIGFGGLGVEPAEQPHASECDDPDDERVRGRRGKPKQNRLPDGAANRDDEGRHHRLGMAGLQPVQCAEQDGGWNEEPSVGGALLEKIGQRGHGMPLAEPRPYSHPPGGDMVANHAEAQALHRQLGRKRSSGVTRALLTDKHVARLDEHRHRVAFCKPEFGNSLLGDVGRDDVASTNIDLYGPVDRARDHLGHPSRELIARTDFHRRLLSQH